MFSGTGQINMSSLFGNEIYTLCKNNNIRNIIEVGTWNGQGSTICVMNAIIDKLNSKLYSLEADSNQYKKAIEFWSTKNTNGKLNLINAILHTEYASEVEIKAVCSGVIPYVNEHYIPEKNMLITNSVFNTDSISDIDAIILDGGEYTSYGDFLVLMKKHPRVIILDDVSVFKCKKIRTELIANNDWILYKENLHDRHGWSIFIHKSFTLV
jgi:hypothetical protein